MKQGPEKPGPELVLELEMELEMDPEELGPDPEEELMPDPEKLSLELVLEELNAEEL